MKKAEQEVEMQKSIKFNITSVSLYYHHISDSCANFISKLKTAFYIVYNRHNWELTATVKLF